MSIEPYHVSGSGSPLFIFPISYSYPNVDIHKAAAFIMENKWSSQMQQLFEFNVQEHLSKTQKVHDAMILYKLTEDEAGAIVYYTSYAKKDDHNLYRVLNTQLAKRDVPASWRPYLYYLIEGLKKIKAYNGIAYRGVPEQLTQLSEQYRTGNTVVWVAFTSTCKKRDTMLQFSDDAKGTWMRIKITDGRDISAFSLKPNEGEVLLLPNAYFLVTKIIDQETKDLVGLPNSVDGIFLEQQETPQILKSMIDFCG